MNRDIKEIRDATLFLQTFKNARTENDSKYLYYLPAHGPYNPVPVVETPGSRTPIESESDWIDLGPYTPDIPTPKEARDEEKISEDDGRPNLVFLPQYKNLYQVRTWNPNEPRVIQVNVPYARKPRPSKGNYFPIENDTVLRLNTCIVRLRLELTNYTKISGNTMDWWIGDGRFTGWWDHMYYWTVDKRNVYTLRTFYLGRYLKIAKDLLMLKNALHDSNPRFQLQQTRQKQIMALLTRVESNFGMVWRR